MPRVNLTQADRDAYADKRREEQFLNILNHGLVDKRVKRIDVAAAIGLEPHALYKKWKEPSRFKWDELCKLIAFLRLPPDTVCKLMGVK